MLRHGTFDVGSKVINDNGEKGEILKIFPGGLILMKTKSESLSTVNSKWYYTDELTLV